MPCRAFHPPAGDPVWVKIVSKTGQRLGLAMRDVDQVTGEDLLPMQRGAAPTGASNPAGPLSLANQTALHGLSGIKVCVGGGRGWCSGARRCGRRVAGRGVKAAWPEWGGSSPHGCPFPACLFSLYLHALLTYYCRTLPFFLPPSFFVGQGG